MYTWQLQKTFKKSGNGRKQTNLVTEVHVNELSDLKPLNTGEITPTGITVHLIMEFLHLSRDCTYLTSVMLNVSMHAILQIAIISV